MPLSKIELEATISGKVVRHPELEGVAGIDPMLGALLASLAVAAAKTILSFCGERVPPEVIVDGLVSGDRRTVRNYKRSVQNLLWRDRSYRKCRDLACADRLDSILCESIIELAQENERQAVSNACRTLLTDEVPEPLDFSIF